MISNPIPVTQSHSNETENINMAFELDPDDDPAVLTVSSLNEEQQPTHVVSVENQAHVIDNPGAFTTENPLYEYPRVQSNCVNVHPDPTHVNVESIKEDIEAPTVELSDENKSNTSNEHENPHEDLNLVAAIDYDKAPNTTTELKHPSETDKTGESNETKDPTKLAVKEDIDRPHSVPVSTHRVSNVSHEDSDDDNVFYD